MQQCTAQGWLLFVTWARGSGGIMGRNLRRGCPSYLCYTALFMPIYSSVHRCAQAAFVNGFRHKHAQWRVTLFDICNYACFQYTSINTKYGNHKSSIFVPWSYNIQLWSFVVFLVILSKKWVLCEFVRGSNLWTFEFFKDFLNLLFTWFNYTYF